MNIIYYRQQTTSARDPAPIEFDVDFAVSEMLRYIFEDFVNSDNYQPYYTIPENFKKTYIKTENKQEFVKILKDAMEKIKKMTFEELVLPSPTPKGEEILRSVKSLHPDLDIEEVKGVVRTRLLEEPADIESSISSASGFLNARELNRYLEHIAKWNDKSKMQNAINIDIQSTGKDKEKITILIDEVKANLSDLELEGQGIDLSGVESIKRLSETKEVFSKIVKIFTLGFTDAKLADKGGATLDILAKKNPPSVFSAGTAKGQKLRQEVLEKDFGPVYSSYLREKSELVVIETMLTLLATIKANEVLYNNVYERFKNSPDALYQLSEDLAEVLGDESLEEISQMFYSLSADAKEFFTTKDEEGEIIIGDVRELVRRINDSEVVIKPTNIVKPLETALKTYKEHKKETNKTESINKEAMKKLTGFIKELKDMIYNQDTKAFNKFDFTPTIEVKIKEFEGKAKYSRSKPKPINTKKVNKITLGTLIRNPNLVSTEGTNKEIANIEEELDELDAKLDDLENQKSLTEQEKKDKSSLEARIKTLLNHLESYEKYNISDVFREVGYLDDDGYTMEFLDDIRKMFDEDIKETKQEFLKVFDSMQDLLFDKNFGGNVLESMKKSEFLDLLKENFMAKRKETKISTYRKELNNVKKVYKSSIRAKEVMIEEFIAEKAKQIDAYSGKPALEREKSREEKFDLAHKQAKKYYDAAKANDTEKIMELVKKSPIKDSLKQVNLLHKITIIINKGVGVNKDYKPIPTYDIDSFRLKVEKEIETQLLPSATGGGSDSNPYKPRKRAKLGITKFKTAKKGDYAIFLDSISAAIPDLQKTIRRLR